LVNSDYCEDSFISTTPAQINKVDTLNNVVTPMGVEVTKDITFVGKKHTLQDFFT